MNCNDNDQEYLVQKIRTRYTEKEYGALEELKALDGRVKAPANTFAYVFGIAAALILGAGMSLIMTDLSESLGMADPMVPGVMIGLVGMLMAAVNYPIYRKILAGRRKKYAGQIIALSEKITKDSANA